MILYIIDSLDSIFSSGFKMGPTETCKHLSDP